MMGLCGGLEYFAFYNLVQRVFILWKALYNNISYTLKWIKPRILCCTPNLPCNPVQIVRGGWEIFKPLENIWLQHQGIRDFFSDECH